MRRSLHPNAEETPPLYPPRCPRVRRLSHLKKKPPHIKTMVARSYLVEPGEGGGRPEQDVDTQTDAFEDRPQTPDFVPKKTGVDASTQIEVSDKLFDFDAEVQPMLAVLVGKVHACSFYLTWAWARNILRTHLCGRRSKRATNQ